MKYSLKLGKASQKFAEFTLSGTVFEIEELLSFAIFCEKFENSKWPPFLVGQKKVENLVSYSEELPYGSNLSKLLYLARFLRYKHSCVLHF